jgi:hypothetical protein
MFFNADDPPQGPFDALLWPLILFVIAALICYFAHKAEWDGKKAPWKWAALVPLVIGLAVGFTAFRLVTDLNYNGLALGKKVTYCLWVDALLPILSLVGFGYWQYWSKNQGQRY